MSDERQPDDASAWAPPGAAQPESDAATAEHPAVEGDPPDAVVVEGEPVDAEPVVETDPVAEPSAAGPADAGVTPQPTPVVPAGAASFEQPPGSALVEGGATRSSSLPAATTQRPELLAGAAFAGGLMAALILRRLGH